jgi:hypothetical protein
MAILSKPKYGHAWMPTPSLGRGGTKDGDHNFWCATCRVIVRKSALINDDVPGVCERVKKDAKQSRRVAA